MPSDSGFSKEVKFSENESGSSSSASQTAKTSSPPVTGNSRSLQDGSTTSSNGQNKKAAVLTPAPLPTRSPWKSMSTDIPVSKIPVEALEGSKKNRPKATNSNTVKSSSSTKWVPIKASIVVSGSKRTGNGKKGSNRQSQGPTGSNSNVGNGSTNNGRPNSTGGRKKKQPQQQQLQHVNAKNRQQQLSALDSSIPPSGVTSSASVNASVTASNDKSNKTKNRTEEDAESKSSSLEAGQQQQQQQPQQSKDRFNKHNDDHFQRKQHYFNNQHHSRNSQGFPRRRYFNNNYHLNANNELYKNSHGFQQHHHPKNNFGPHHGGSGRPFNNHYRGPRYPGPMHQQPVPPMYQQHFHPMQAIIIAVNSVARQIEYYFSTENLEKDDYLRSKLSGEGYAPVTLISKFYRVNNMSFGGDPYLILASLREIVANEQSTVDIAIGSLTKSNFELDAQDEESPLAKYFIRSKKWSDLLPENVYTEIKIEKNLEGNEMDEFLITPLPMPSVYAPGPSSGPSSGPPSAPVPVPVPVPVPAPVPAAANATPEDKQQESEDNN